MSRWGKILFFVAWIAIATVFAVRYVLGGWIEGLFVPLAISVVCFIGAFAIDFKFYLEFFTMRTTKHGLNMGTMILLVLIGLVTVNVLAVRKNKVVDITEDKLFSLSEQTLTILKSLKEPLRTIIFYRGDKSRNALNSIRETLRLYQDNSSRLNVEFYDSYVENVKAQQYLNSLPDKDSAENQAFMFVEYGDKRERVTAPFGETEITSAIVKVSRKSSKLIYFLTGHGERELESEGDEGIRTLKTQLEQFAAQVKPLNLLQGEKIPADATAIVIAGPKAPLMDQEIETLKNYLSSGGQLLIMADPGEKHNLTALLGPMGVEFANTFIVNVGVQVQGASQLTAVGLDFDQASDITKPFVNGNSFALFQLAGEVRKSSVVKSEIVVSDLVRTSPKTMSIAELSNEAARGELRAYSIGVLSKGKMPATDGKAGTKDFSAVIFGDSDFASNKLIGLPTNLNLILNAVAHLTGEIELISVRPKQPKGTKLVMTNMSWLAIVVGVGVLVPLGLVIGGSLIWFRRRSA